MRIAIVRTPEVPEDCGTGLVAAALAAAGHRIRVVTDLPDDPALVRPDGAGDLRVDTLTPATLTDGLASAWADDPPELVHAVGPAAARAAGTTGLPVVLSYPAGVPARSGADDDPLPVGRARVLAASEDQHTALLRLGVPRAVLRTVPACVDTDVFTPEGPALRRDEHPRIVTLGSLADGAGAGAAIRALARVPGAELLVGGGATGDDADRARLFAVAESVGVAGRVRFLGPVGAATVPRLLRSADVVVAAPGHDVPVAPALQAMACSRPVVASGVGGLRDAVVDGVTGLHVRPGRVDDLAVAVREILADDGLRTGFGIAGRDRAVSRFDRSRIADALTGVYTELLEGRAATPETAGDADPADLPDAAESEDPVEAGAGAERQEPVGATG
ncbi:glycosyltransferase [Pseudonocardia sp. Ae168_Ps1]|uniref:glycosyltransferase n=1 Tax=Pseudonocardia sp. Ae168_Ps1 TaxID=1885029 RepID=UPI000A4B4E57|nr:glycosyltransferase [Pseudonocardia sp. Ae168_Ps1]